ncbi:CRISPR-associated endonuclease/helicase Cas3 [Sinosporangium album]|uniref:CRISPR-associated endonuclease/helicase Cas3 n=1 Tax=Sinosporangium album TaxID=504805 RepID=A0A1G8LF50_9ACTN|nr:CRISPR-associated endonuclease Cas3'' [Sinosporangium album]SDI54097.1 CRISPR-associated endonuclease/helicase Cas3 [Sinosporangium album]
MAGKLWAHSARSSDGLRHELGDHLRGTSRRAGEFADPFDAGKLSAHCGLVHDVGKGSCDWQSRLMRAEKHGGRVGGMHKHAGTWLLDQQGLGIMAAIVFGHHGGLPSRSRLKAELQFADTHPLVAEAIGRVGEIVPEIHLPGPIPLPGWLPDAAATDPYALDLLVRMVYSTVVDADYLDTEAHFEAAARPMHPTSAAGLVERYEQGRVKMLADVPPSPVDGHRSEVYAQAVDAAAGPRGIYRLPGPTGSGKSLAMGGFGVHHARRHGMNRVIVAVPFMSITEQNAAVFRNLLDRDCEDPIVLEHHSGIDLDDGDPAARWQRLAAENWDAPFVVTTTIRLFESLFSNKPSAMRRVHRLAGAVIVLDEVQALPDHLLIPILSALRTLTDYFGTTVLLASATQPPFELLSPLRGTRIREVIAQPKPLYKALNRVRYRWLLDPKPTMAQIADEIAAEPQVLAVVNSTSDAHRLHRMVDERRPSLHLSTRMAAAHRRKTLEEIRRLLADGEPVAVVSTQLVEAGVDVDFPKGFRAYASADSMQQAAGRVNRSGRLAYGRMTIFDPEDGNKAAKLIYGAALEATRDRFGPHCPPDDLDAMEAYYKARFDFHNVEQAGQEIQKERQAHDFPRVAELFRMIDEWTVPVAVRYGDIEQLERIVAHLRGGHPGSSAQLRALRPYVATLPRGAATRAVDDGMAAPVVGDLIEWLGDYHPQRGIEVTSPDPEELVF